MAQKTFFITPLFILLTYCFITNAQPVILPEPLSPRIANYNIDVRLEPVKHILWGKELLTWKNSSADFIDELQFHLYLNAFRNNRSTYMRESQKSWIDEKFEPDEWGYIDVMRIASETGEDLTGRMQFIHPDDDNGEDMTVFRLPLPSPIPPGGSIVLNIEFKAKFSDPPINDNGVKQEYVLAAQWFPKVGVYWHGKWNCHQYHYHGEFFADLGVYNVRITVPEKNIVGATGIEVSRQKNADSTVTYFYRAEDVHDFAWTASPDFVEFNDKSQDVSIRVLMQKDHAGQGLRHIKAAQLAVEYFQNTYGDYPFPNLTIVDPRRGAMQTAGMEYPTLIVTQTSYGIPSSIRFPELVILHEFGHNYWYHLIANNEFEEAWLDEGITTYSENQIFNDLYGSNGNLIDVLGIKLDDIHFHRSGYNSLPDRDPVVRNAWDFHSNGSYGILSYYKAGLALTTLHNYLGKETMVKIMREFLTRWRFKHPRTQDFIDVANQVSEQNLDWFFQQVLFSNAVLDYSVSRISSKEVETEIGFDFSGSTKNDSVFTINANATTDSLEKSSKNKKKSYLNKVTIDRLGSFIFPVELQIVFTNGDTLYEKWDGQEYWKDFTYIRPVKIAFATIDPDHKIPMDVNLTIIAAPTNRNLWPSTDGQLVVYLQSNSSWICQNFY